jgi:hypothetical protein
MNMSAWLQSHIWIVYVLSAIVVVDHALASTDLVKSSSTAQAVVAAIGKAGDWLMAMINPKSPGA